MCQQNKKKVLFQYVFMYFYLQCAVKSGTAVGNRGQSYGTKRKITDST